MLKKLCMLNGTSGREHSVRDFIISKIPADCEYTVDRLGNIICEKKGRNRAKNKVMLSAHMDEVGFIITYITDEREQSIEMLQDLNLIIFYAEGLLW